jgi:hypothetical protein
MIAIGRENFVSDKFGSLNPLNRMPLRIEHLGTYPQHLSLFVVTVSVLTCVHQDIWLGGFTLGPGCLSSLWLCFIWFAFSSVIALSFVTFRFKVPCLFRLAIREHRSTKLERL